MATKQRDLTSEGLTILQGSSRRDFLKRLVAGAAACGAGGLDVALASEWNAAARQSPPTYTNPVYAGSMPDPFVLLHQGTYYAFGTTGSDRTPDGRVFTVLQSTDLVDWKERGGALTPPTPDAAYQVPGRRKSRTRTACSSSITRWVGRKKRNSRSGSRPAARRRGRTPTTAPLSWIASVTGSRSMPTRSRTWTGSGTCSTRVTSSTRTEACSPAPPSSWTGSWT